MAIFVFFDILNLSCIRSCRRKEREQKKSAKAQKGKSAAKKRGASTKSKAEPPKKKEKAEKKKIIDEEEEEEGEEVEHEEIEKNIAPDTSGDAALAESMSGKRVSTRNLDAKGDKFKKAAALAKIREVSCLCPMLLLFCLIKWSI